MNEIVLADRYWVIKVITARIDMLEGVKVSYKTELDREYAFHLKQLEESQKYEDILPASFRFKSRGYLTEQVLQIPDLRNQLEFAKYQARDWIAIPVMFYRQLVHQQIGIAGAQIHNYVGKSTVQEDDLLAQYGLLRNDNYLLR